MELTEYLKSCERGAMSRNRYVSLMRPRVSIVRQIARFDCGKRPHARRLRESLEPATVMSCLVTGGFDIPTEGIVLSHGMNVSCLATEANPRLRPSLACIMLAERANLVTITLI
jgi:hypothetical protein